MSKKCLASVFSLLLISCAVKAENTINYSSRAWSLDQSGTVVAVYDIDKNGKPENVNIVESTPKYLFDDSVKDQIYKWRFDKGQPKQGVRVRINFKK